MSIVSRIFSSRSSSRINARLAFFMDNLFAIGFGLGLRFVIDNIAHHDFKLTSILVGLWEGVVTLHFLRKMPKSVDPYIAYATRLLVDFLVTENPTRLILVVVWTGLGMVLADIAPAIWHDVGGRRKWRRVRRDLYYMSRSIPSLPPLFPRARVVRFSPVVRPSEISESPSTPTAASQVSKSDIVSPAPVLAPRVPKRPIPGGLVSSVISETDSDTTSVLGLRPGVSAAGTSHAQYTIRQPAVPLDHSGSHTPSSIDGSNVSSDSSSSSTSTPTVSQAADIDDQEEDEVQAHRLEKGKGREMEEDSSGTPTRLQIQLPPTPSDSYRPHPNRASFVPTISGMPSIPDFFESGLGSDWENIRREEVEVEQQPSPSPPLDREVISPPVQYAPTYAPSVYEPTPRPETFDRDLWDDVSNAAPPTPYTTVMPPQRRSRPPPPTSMIPRSIPAIPQPVKKIKKSQEPVPPPRIPQTPLYGDAWDTERDQLPPPTPEVLARTPMNDSSLDFNQGSYTPPMDSAFVPPVETEPQEPVVIHQDTADPSASFDDPWLNPSQPPEGEMREQQDMQREWGQSTVPPTPPTQVKMPSTPQSPTRMPFSPQAKAEVPFTPQQQPSKVTSTPLQKPMTVPPTPQTKPPTLPPTPQQKPSAVPPTPQHKPVSVPPTPHKRPTGIPSTPQQQPPPTPQQQPAPVPPTPHKRPTGIPSTPQQQPAPVPPTPQQQPVPVPPTPQQQPAPVPPTPQRQSAPTPPTPQQPPAPIPPTPQSKLVKMPPTPKHKSHKSSLPPPTPQQKSSPPLPPTPQPKSSLISSFPEQQDITEVPLTSQQATASVPPAQQQQMQTMYRTPKIWAQTLPPSPRQRNQPIPPTPSQRSRTVPSTPQYLNKPIPPTPSGQSRKDLDDLTQRMMKLDAGNTTRNTTGNTTGDTTGDFGDSAYQQTQQSNEGNLVDLGDGETGGENANEPSKTEGGGENNNGGGESEPHTPEDDGFVQVDADSNPLSPASSGYSSIAGVPSEIKERNKQAIIIRAQIEEMNKTIGRLKDEKLMALGKEELDPLNEESTLKEQEIRRAEKSLEKLVKRAGKRYQAAVDSTQQLTVPRTLNLNLEKFSPPDAATRLEDVIGLFFNSERKTMGLSITLPKGGAGKGVKAAVTKVLEEYGIKSIVKVTGASISLAGKSYTDMIAAYRQKHAKADDS